MDSIKEAIKNMPRVSAEIGQPVVLETRKDGIVISEIICYIEEIEYNPISKKSDVKLNCYNPHYIRNKTITSYEF